MAVTADMLTRALRAGTDTDTRAEVTRLVSVAQALVETYLSGASAPEAVQDEAVIRLASYLFDQPTVSAGLPFANAGRNSGAWSLLAPYRVQRAASIEAT